MARRPKSKLGNWPLARKRFAKLNESITTGLGRIDFSKFTFVDPKARGLKTASEIPRRSTRARLRSSNGPNLTAAYDAQVLALGMIAAKHKEILKAINHEAAANVGLKQASLMFVGILHGHSWWKRS